MMQLITRRTAGLIAPLVVLALTTAVPGAAAQRVRVITVTGSLHAVPDGVPDPTLCNAAGGSYVAGPTDVPESGTSVLRGTFEGTGRFCGHTTGLPGPDGSVQFVETNTFTGTVHGCGTGTVTYHVKGYVGALPDPARGGLPTEEDWQVVAGSGTGGLSGLRSGGGHNSGQINLDGSIDTDFKGRVRCVPSSAATVPRKKRPVPTYTTAVSGDWYVTGCAPTSVPSSPTFPMKLTGVCTGEATGSWTGLVVDHTRAVMDEDLTLRSQDDIHLSGRAADGTCGSLHIRQTITVAGETSELKGVATIVGGTGDWVGSTGSYRTSGVLNAGVGLGTYSGVWRRPGTPTSVEALDCRPGLPVATS